MSDHDDARAMFLADGLLVDFGMSPPVDRINTPPRPESGTTPGACATTPSGGPMDTIEDRHPEAPTLFRLIRRHDWTGRSGTGHVANVVRWPDGTCTVRWCSNSAKPTTVMHEDLMSVLNLHGHGGATVLECIPTNHHHRGDFERGWWLRQRSIEHNWPHGDMDYKACAQADHIDLDPDNAEAERGWLAFSWTFNEANKANRPPTIRNTCHA